MIKINRLIKQDSNTSKKKGITLVELVIASGITVLILGVIFTLWMFAERAWRAERTKAKLLAELVVVMERLKKEIKGSSGGEMFFYPSTAPYTAISFPVAIPDGSGFVTLNGDGTIRWDRTIIYHLYPVSNPTELIRTILYPRISLSGANRQLQLNNVVTNGDGESLPEGLKPTGGSATISTRTLISQPLISGNPAISLNITPKPFEFDGYNATDDRSSNVSFGSIDLTSGYHTLKFKVIGKNTLSGGHGLGIDLLRITPSGSDREGEDYTFLKHPDLSDGIAASSGDTITRENIEGWSGDYHLDYAASAVSDYITLSFYNDVWRESNFESGTPDLVTVELSDRNGVMGSTPLTSADIDVIVRLEGGGKVWEATEQTGGDKVEGSAITPTPPPPEPGGDTYRNIILGSYIEENGKQLRIKFSAGLGAVLPIAAASIYEREEVQDGEDKSYKKITFIDSGGGDGITIPIGESKWSDWIDVLDRKGNASNTDNTEDYLVSIYIASGANYSIASWEETGEIHSYSWNGNNHVADYAWGTSGTEQAKIYGVEEIEVRYADAGTFTSQVYDTGIADPTYEYITWDIVRNNHPDASLILKVRSDDDKSDLLKNRPKWKNISGIDTGSAAQGKASISTLARGRYVQFQAELTAEENPSEEQTAAQYDMSCVLKDVAIYWDPGGTTACDLSGYFTLKNTYGIFGVELDTKLLTKGFKITLSISEGVLETTVTRSLTAEVEPRNTRK